METKRCSGIYGHHYCVENGPYDEPILPLHKFSSDVTTPDGKQRICKICRREWHQRTNLKYNPRKNAISAIAYHEAGSKEAFYDLPKEARQSIRDSATLEVFIKIDTGYHRTGLPPDSPEIEEITVFLKSTDKLSFSGFLTHAGNTYHAKGKEEILKIMSSAGKQLSGLKNRYIKDFPGIITSYGDTPSCSMADDCPGFDEIRPGNFAYYDVMQYHIGSCGLNEIAVAVACPVVSLHPGREEMVVYGGAIHLSKENIEAGDGFKFYGYVVNFTGNGWSNPLPGAYVSSLSQEHGIIKIPEKYLKNYKPGNLIGILPVHSCLTANLLKNQIII